MDLDDRALGNAGLWCIGRLQTDADCARVVDGLAASVDPENVHLLFLTDSGQSPARVALTCQR